MPTPPLTSIATAWVSPERLREFHIGEWNRIATNTTRLMIPLLAMQLLVLVAVSIGFGIIDPDQNLLQSTIAIALGIGLFASSWILAISRAERIETRLMVAVAQMGYGFLFSSATAGHIDYYFLALASLAVLSAYRDWRPLAVAGMFAYSDIALRSVFLAQPELHRIERAVGITFELVFLLFIIRQSQLEMLSMAERQANLESTREYVERTVHDRMLESRASEQRLKAVYNAVADGIVTVDDRLAIESLNPTAEELLGYSRQELVGQPLQTIMAGAEGLISDALMDSTQSGLMPQPDMIGSELFGLRRDGSRFPMELAISKTRSGTGLMLVGVFRDVTARRSAENALKASEARYRQLFESNPHAMWVVDSTTGRILAVNDSAIEHYGYDRDTFLRMSISDLDPPSDPGLSNFDMAIPIGGQLEELRSHRIASGELRQMEIATRPIEFDGQPAALMMAIDVTARKLLEEQLKQAQKLESIGQLAAGIAHEINTPIQYIGDNTTYVNDSFREVSEILAAYRAAGSDPQAIREAEAKAKDYDLDLLVRDIPSALSQSLEGVGHVARIVRAMKEFAHPGTVEKVPVDLNHTIETVIAVARNEWKYVAEIETKLDPNLPNVLGLPGELNQVFLNLVVNAAHAIRSANSGDMKGRITISTRRIGGMAEVRIADTGSGIPEAIRGRIFDPYFTTKPIGQGTGQGLTIAHAVVEQKHGGAISFQTELGRGTTFIVRLPIRADRLSNSERIHVTEIVRVPASMPEPNDWQASAHLHSNLT